MRRIVITMLALLGLAASPAAAQSVYELDESGQWVEKPAAPTGEDESVMTEVRRLIAEGRAGTAYDIINDWIERHEGQTLPETPLAYRLRGDALTAMGREFRALYDYELVARSFPQSEEFPIVVEREYDIAQQYLGGLRKKFFGLRIENAEDIGVELLIRVHERMPGSELGERASIAVADHYFEEREMAWAVEAYNAYLSSYPQGPNRDRALKRRVIANLAQYRGPQRDVTSLLDARRQIAQLQRELPREAERLELDERMVSMIDEELAAQTLESAKWRLKRGEDPAARFILERLVQRRPNAEAAAEARRMLAERGWLAEPVEAVSSEDES
jgi:hypothetical protein